MEALEAKIAAQGNLVRDLKKAAAPAEQLAEQVLALKSLKQELDVLKKSFVDVIKAKEVLREGLDQLLVRKFFFITSFEIYSGVAGLYDYGPTGWAMMSHLQSLWRQHFVLEESMHEISCSSITPHDVLKTSGHVDRFTDYLVHDSATNDPFRADKIVEEHLEKLMTADPSTAAVYEKDFNNAGSMTGTELDACIKKYSITNNGNAFTASVPFNLMFQTTIGPSARSVAFLRPETAQGIFVNFRRLYEFNNRQLPFAAAQIGSAYRNEIAPRGGLLRVREFCMAEIEHFVHPERKQHPSFASVDHITASFWSGENQTTGLPPVPMTFKEAVGKGIVNNETLGYFLARTYIFLTQIGIDPTKLRFRQHRRNEMAHYATDCWDAEINTTYGWIECVGHADRSAYDLQVHSQATGTELSVTETLETPIVVRKWVIKPNRGAIGKKYRQQAGELFSLFDSMTQDVMQQKATEFTAAGCVVFSLPASGVDITLEKADIEILQVDQKVSVDVYTPHVIEPSFGLGRVIYCLLEHAYYVRKDDEQRKVLRLPPCIAPVKVAIYNVVSSIPYQPILESIRRGFVTRNIAVTKDITKGSIGRKYSRGDEIGVPYAISIDAQSCEKGLVTIRERDSCQQVQVHQDEVVKIISNLVKGKWTWNHVYTTYPVFVANESLE